jgi:hypothetical protein
MGGQLTRMWISLAPQFAQLLDAGADGRAATMESSTMTTRLPLIMVLTD